MLNFTIATTTRLNELEAYLRELRDNPYFLTIVVVASILGIFTAFTMDRERP